VNNSIINRLRQEASATEELHPGDSEIMVMREAAAQIERLNEILNRPFHGGSRVTNCVLHMGSDWHDRPKTCENCRTDMANTLNYAIRVNEFLNQVVDDAKALATM